MEKINAVLCFILVANCLLSVSSFSNGETSNNATPEQQHNKKTWCVARDDAPAVKLQGAIDYACSQPGIDCGPIKPGGVCFEPNTLKSHATWTLCMLYSRVHVCGDVGTVTDKDPAHGECHYPMHPVPYATRVNP